MCSPRAPSESSFLLSDPAFGFFAIETALIRGGYTIVCWYSKDGYNWSAREQCSTSSLITFATAANGVIIATSEIDHANTYDISSSRDGGRTWITTGKFANAIGRPSVIAEKFVVPIQDSLLVSSDSIQWDMWLSIRLLDTSNFALVSGGNFLDFFFQTFPQSTLRNNS